MAAEEKATARGYAIPALAPPSLQKLDQPLDYLLAEHFRQRSLCSELRAIADQRSVRRRVADAIVAYLVSDFERHHQDEEDALFPALRRRLRSEDHLGVILAQLIEDHRQTEAMSESIVEALAGNAAADPVEASQATAELLLAFTDSENRHLAIENAIVLVIARKRLTTDDLKSMSRRMKFRRGILI